MEAAPPVLKLLAHDVRWRLVKALAQSDRRVGELVNLLDVRHNLVSYHLRLLREAELVSERRSSRDARDVYYTLEPDAVRDALNHAGGHLAASPAGARPVLFVCTGNSARSVMAEALLRDATRGTVPVASAGTQPQGVHPVALRVLTGRGVATEGLHSKGFDELGDQAFETVITLCDIVREQCSTFPAHSRLVHWSIADPAAVAGSPSQVRAAFERTADDLSKRIAALTAAYRR
ncbi:MAG TPA: metalloregulator ArsR/SmtB family transcription factor [Candidatus Dormibacteraeota bacterium]